MKGTLARRDHFPVLSRMVLGLLSYRVPMPVSELMVFPNSFDRPAYYVCPRCGLTMEREFMAFCDRCGQRLGWKEYRRVKIICPGQNHGKIPRQNS